MIVKTSRTRTRSDRFAVSSSTLEMVTMFSPIFLKSTTSPRNWLALMSMFDLLFRHEKKLNSWVHTEMCDIAPKPQEICYINYCLIKLKLILKNWFYYLTLNWTQTSLKLLQIGFFIWWLKLSFRTNRWHLWHWTLSEGLVLTYRCS